MLDVWALSLIIAVREGWNKPTALVHRLNNPCALKYIGQRFSEPGPRGFARFATEWDGWVGCRLDIAAKVREGRSLKRGWRYLPKGLELEVVEGVW